MVEIKTNKYVAFYKGRCLEVEAETSLAANAQAVEKFKANKKKPWEVTVVLAERDGKPVVHIMTE